MSSPTPNPVPPLTSGVRFRLDPLTPEERRTCDLEDQVDNLKREVRQARAEVSIAELTARCAEDEAKQARRETATLKQALESLSDRIGSRLAALGLRRHDGLPVPPWERGFTVPVQGPGGREWWNPDSGQVEKG